MAKSQTNQQPVKSNLSQEQSTAPGRILALDIGTRRVGVAVSDEIQLTVRPLPALMRPNWKKFLRELEKLCRQFDVTAIVLGLPLTLEGRKGTAALTVQRIAQNLRLTLSLPVFLQDERYTSLDAQSRLRANRRKIDQLRKSVDSEAAALILSDYISNRRDHRLTSDVDF